MFQNIFVDFDHFAIFLKNLTISYKFLMDKKLLEATNLKYVKYRAIQNFWSRILPLERFPKCKSFGWCRIFQGNQGSSKSKFTQSPQAYREFDVCFLCSNTFAFFYHFYFQNFQETAKTMETLYVIFFFL